MAALLKNVDGYEFVMFRVGSSTFLFIYHEVSKRKKLNSLFVYLFNSKFIQKLLSCSELILFKIYI
jgi:hypothetical protein